uniref:THAP domain-containing protein 1 n=1 Tax=Nothobranchius kadleci TaxID=1051664 RepID=A0A1A8CF61_NOTKA
MPSFGFLDTLELYLQTGKFPVNASKNVKRGIRAASKRFMYKDGCLWRSYRSRLLRVVRSEKEVREILTRYHDNNNHAGRERAVREIMMMYYWFGVTEAVKNWVKSCSVCHERTLPHSSQQSVFFCLVYGCDSSSYAFPELSFHRFPKDVELRKKWLEVAQRDEGSLRPSSYICSRHFDASCFTLTEEGQLTLSPDAVPIILPTTVHGAEVPEQSDEDFLHSNSWKDELTRAAVAAAARAIDHSDPPCDPFETAVGLLEHQYCIPGPAPDSRAAKMMTVGKRTTLVETSFVTYNHIAKYLSTRMLPMQGKKSRTALKRMAKRFDLIDGVLMYTRASPPLRVPRSREEVNSILQQFHDNQGHYGQGICQREIAKHFYWGNLSRDLASWISSCQTCLNRTKRKMLRCSISKCTNRCGPVERKLGLTFHKFPLHNLPVLAQWMKAVGRVHWHPRLWSSICSTHFTEDCFDRSGDKVILHPDSVPTLNIHGDSVTPAVATAQQPLGEEAFFAKYDAVELYISRRTYPPGLTYVEKNTFRRFCKKYAIIDGSLHFVSGERVRLVLRNRQQIDDALVDFHDELNHLSVNKCLRLLNERYFWKTMKYDVMQWINNCSQCSLKMIKKPSHREQAEQSDILLQALASPDRDSDSGRDENSEYACDDDDDDNDDGDHDGRGDGDIEEEQILESVDAIESSLPPLSSQTTSPTSPQPRIPILIHLRTPNNLQPRTSVILQPKSPSPPLMTQIWSVNMAAPGQSEVSNSSESLPGDPLQGIPPPKKKSKHPEEQNGTGSSKSSARTHQAIQAQGTTIPVTEPRPPPRTTKIVKATEPRRQRSSKKPGRRKTVADPSDEGSSSCGLEPVVAPSSKPWPVFTIANSGPGQAAQPVAEDDSTPLLQRSKQLQARIVIQQCSHAKVKVRPALDGAESEWAEIQQGMVVYVCFLQGVTVEVIYEIASKLMSTKLFRRERHTVSVLDLPGSVLLVPQDSLVGEPLPNKRMQYKGGCELWLGAQLFSNLVSACRQLMSTSTKCSRACTKVEYGVYGQKQEIVLTSLEPMSLLLDF